MDKVSDILGRLSSLTPSKWREMAKYRRDCKLEIHGYRKVALMILDRMHDLGLTAEHVANDTNIPLEEFRDIVSGKYPISDINKNKLVKYLGLSF